MLSKLRDFSRSKLASVLIAIIIIPFVFWGMGSVFSGGNTNNVAKVGNVNISTQDFIEFINQSRIDPEDIRNNLDKNILEEILSQIISLNLLDLEMKDIGIVVSDAALYNKIILDKNFKDNNNFSRLKYEKFLIENNISAPEYERKLKESELQIDLFQYINGGVISPRFLTKNKFIEESKLINLKFINLEKIYKSSFTNDEVNNYIKENQDELKKNYINLEYAILSPENLTESNEFNENFFNQIDNIENDIFSGENINNLASKYNLKLIKLNNYAGENNDKKFLKDIYNKINEDGVEIIESENFFVLYEIKEINKKLPNLNYKVFYDEILDKLINLEKFNYNKKLLKKIENNEFKDEDFNLIAKEQNDIEKTQITSINDNNFFNVDSLNLLYTIPEKDFLLIVDNNKNIYLTKVDSFEYQVFDNNDKNIIKYSSKSKFSLKNNISKTYDDFINLKYKVSINNNTIERLKNYFK